MFLFFQKRVKSICSQLQNSITSPVFSDVFHFISTSSFFSTIQWFTFFFSKSFNLFEFFCFPIVFHKTSPQIGGVKKANANLEQYR
uniref:Uncharacterized protein n=1 Tax=Pyxicephalus adspersus TaxID=30357 RepID=A0AAV3AXX9_PYXAD|nr:TPA: hypothetical protein GDO54_008121 [Pyxicephalus adspersus]